MSDDTIVFDFATASTPKSELATRLKSAAKILGEGQSGGLKSVSEGRKEEFSVSPYTLTIKEGWNSRDPNNPENAAHIDWLARSIAEEGVREALCVNFESGKIVVTDGHCRLLATFRAIEVYGAEIATVPVKTEPKSSSEADRLLSQILRNSGKRLEPIEYASVIARLEKFGWSHEKIGMKCAISLATVRFYLDMNSAPQEVKQMVVEGSVSSTLATRVVQSSSSDEQATKTLRGAVDAAKAEGKTKATPRHLSPKPPKPNVKREVAAIIDRIISDEQVVEDDTTPDKVAVWFTRDQWKMVIKLLEI